MYTLDELMDKFGKHAIESDKSRIKLIEDWKQENPGQEVPEWMIEDFNLPLALCVLCKEIKMLKTLCNATGWVHKGDLKALDMSGRLTPAEKH